MSTYPNALGHRNVDTSIAAAAAAMPMHSNRDRQSRALKLHRRAAFGEVSIVRPPIENGGKRPTLQTGTACAISYLSLGVAAQLPCSTGRGGARNHADRESHALTAKQVANLITATAHADVIGLPLTRMISIHWEAAGVPLAGMVKASGRFTDLMGKALSRHGSTAAWLWVHENGDMKGGHCHLLAHVPAALVPMLTGLQKGWLRSITGKPYRARVIHSKPIGGRLGLETGNPDLHTVNLEASLAYTLKGGSAAAASQLGLERLVEPGGRVIGRRCSTSQNIAAKARKGRAQ